MDKLKAAAMIRKVCATCDREFTPDPQLVHCPHDGTLLAANFEDPFVGMVLAEKYTVMAFLGEGGYSRVYRAEHVDMKRSVAIKILRSELCPNPASVKRFQIEAQAAAKLKHPNIAAVYDYGMLPDGHPYIVMEHIEGGTLVDRIEWLGPLSAEQCVRVFSQACDALAAAHAAGILHRDLKPHNFIFSEKDGVETVRLVDFGLAKLTDTPDDPQLTGTGQTLGTPAYMSPEQCTGQQLDARSDIYGLGLVLYYALTGITPIDGHTQLEAMHRQIYEYPPRLREAKPGIDVPAELENAMFTAIDKEPANRFQSMAEFKQALVHGWKGKKLGQWTQAPKLPGRSQPRNSVAMAVVVAVSLLICAGVGWRVFQGESAQQVAAPPDVAVDLSNRRLAEDIIDGANLNATRLNMAGSWWTTPGLLTRVGRFGKLRDLDISNSKIDKETIEALATLHELRGLSLEKTDVKDLGNALTHLPPLIEVLDLSMSTCDNDQIYDFAHLANLRVLNISLSGMHQGDLDALEKFPNLTELNVAHAPITDEAVHSIAKLSKLETLNLCDTDLRGESLLKLAALKNLKQLDLTDCKHLDPRPVQKLKLQMPQCKITI